MITQSLLRKALLSLCLLWLAGCQTAPTPAELPRELRSSSVVSTSARSFDPQPGSRIRWRSDIAVHATTGTPDDTTTLTYIRQQLEYRLQDKGYVWVADGQPVDYLVQGLIVVGTELNETALRDILGFDPGLATGDTAYQTGTLLLLLINPDNRQTEWRSAVEILTAPELAEDLRQQRIQYGINSLLRPLPDARPRQP